MIDMMLLVRPGDAYVITISGGQLPIIEIPSPRFVSDIHTSHAAMGTEGPGTQKGAGAPHGFRVNNNLQASSNMASYSIIQTDTDEDPIRR